MIRRWAARAASVIRSNDGVVAIQMALTLTALLGMAGLATDIGLILYKQRQMQVAADAAAFSGAIALSTFRGATTLSSAQIAQISAAAAAVAAQNGFATPNGVSTTTTSNGVTTVATSNGVTTVVVTPTISQVQVKITQPQSPFLAAAILPKTFEPFAVSGQAVAALPTVSPCVVALGSGDASGNSIALTGGTKISASTANCVVAAKSASICVPYGTSITAEDVYVKTLPASACATGTISPAAKQAPSSDPLAANAGVAAANARTSVAAALTNPTVPAIPSIPAVPAVPAIPAMPAAPSVPSGTAVTFGYTQYPPTLPTGCTATGPQYSANWTVTCTAGRTYNFGSLTVSGGTLNFNLNASATYNFSGAISTNGGTTTSFGAGTFNIAGAVTNGGNSLTFGSGTFYLAGGLQTSNGTTTFGSGTFYIGNDPSCSGNASICNSSTLTFGGPSTFVLASGISSSNSASFGANTSGNAYAVGGPVTNSSGSLTFGSGTFNFAAALTSSSGTTTSLGAGATGNTYDFGGIVTGGGSSLTFGSGTFLFAQGLAATGGATSLGAGASSEIYDFGGPVTSSGSSLTLGSGTFLFAQGLTTSGSSANSFGASTSGNTYDFGGLVTTSGSSSLTFGSGTFILTQGLAKGSSALANFGASTSGNTYDFGGSVTNTNGALSFGSGTFNFAPTAGIVTGGGTTTTFGNGAFDIGQGPSCSGDGGMYSICHSGSTLTFAGPSTFVLTSGIYNNGGETITFGSGSTLNSYSIGASSNNYALNVGGGSTTTFNDATGTNFEAVGDLYTSGGSCVTLPAANIHDINGTISLSGGLTLGSGLYAIAGNFWLGVNSGGSSCSGVTGSNLTIAVTGSSPKGVEATPSGTPLPAVYISAGYGNVTLSAPTSGIYQNVAIVGPLLATATNGITLAEGGTATVGGALYFPNGPMALSGGAYINYGSGQCLEIVATQIVLIGGTSIAASQCFATSTVNGAVLVQ